MNVAPSTILDVDWKFGVTAASSESDRLGKTFLQLKLLVDEGNGKTSNIFTEMNLVQFYKFLHDLEKAKSNLELLQ
ncbi:COMM domain-containing protein 7-like [Athalia rosae]|uniref:COMM domain-containing protein 7-like n=1 Tax=Athalia rosae TaxID=37344 RepID=UPI0020342780|nr:COMM domain-containing protein 7-like [Athalia rosae]XP_048510930.1 COMM domain-containing protein 7-like [Athalia rosae]